MKELPTETKELLPLEEAAVLKAKVILAIKYVAANFLFFDREDDSHIPEGMIEKIIRTGELTYKELGKYFADQVKVLVETTP